MSTAQNSSLATVVLALTISACGNSSDAETPRLQLDVFEQATYLQYPNRDIRTAQFFRVRLSSPQGLPVTGLTRDDFIFLRDGMPTTQENLTVPTGSLARVDINLCIDNSRSLLDDDDPNDGVDTFVNALKQESKSFITTLRQNDFVSTLRIFRFSTESRTRLVGTFVASSTTPTGYAPDALAAIDREIGPTDADLGTAFFYCLEQSFASATPGRQTLHVIFSDGREEGSPPFTRERVLQTITDVEEKVYALGVGNVDPADLNNVARFGRSFVRTDVSQVGELFDDVIKDVQSIYAIVFSTPLQEGEYTLTFNALSTAGTTSLNTPFSAGRTLVLNSYALPVVPGTVLRYQAPLGSFEYRVLPLDAGATDADGRFLAGVDVRGPQTAFDGVPDLYSGVFGAGEIRSAVTELDPYLFLPADFRPNSEWVLSLPDGQGVRQLVRLVSSAPENLTVGSDVVTTIPVDVFDAKTEAPLYKAWFAPAMGLVKQDTNGQVLMLQEVPAIPEQF